MWSEVIMYMPATEIAMIQSREYFRDMEKINNYHWKTKMEEEENNK